MQWPRTDKKTYSFFVTEDEAFAHAFLHGLWNIVKVGKWNYRVYY